MFYVGKKAIYRVADGLFEVGETIALYEGYWKRVAPLSKINYSLENEKLYRKRTNLEYKQLFQGDE